MPRWQTSTISPNCYWTAEQIHQLAHRAEILKRIDRLDHVGDMRIGQNAGGVSAEFLLDLGAR